MTESGTTPPPRRDAPATPAPGRPRRDAAAEDGHEPYHRPRVASSEWEPVPVGTGMPRLLIEFDSVAQGVGLSPPDDEPTPARAGDGLPKGVVRAESHMSRLPKILGDAAPLPTVVVRADDGAPGLDAATEPAPPPAFSTLVIPPNPADFPEPDDFVVGGPEPADWVRLPSDPRTAPTQPSIRRRARSESRISPDAPTPVEPSAERRRDRTRRVAALSIGALVALLGFSSLLLTRLFDDPPSPPVSEPAIEAARAAVALPKPVPDLRPTVAEPQAPPAAEAPPAIEPVPAIEAQTRPKAPSAARPRPVRIQSGVAAPAPVLASGVPSRRTSAPPSSSQPKKRLWFPPE